MTVLASEITVIFSLEHDHVEHQLNEIECISQLILTNELTELNDKVISINCN